MLLLLLDLDLIGTQSSLQAAIGESGAEESEEDEEWNYIKVEDKKSQQSELVAVEENIEQAVVTSIEEKHDDFEVEKAAQDFEEKEEPPTAPIEFATNEFEFNVSKRAARNMLIILIKTHQSIIPQTFT